MKIQVDLDFEQLDKLPIEEYNKLERQYLEFVTKLMTSSEEDYCRKKGTTRKEVMKDYISYSKMRNAMNKRKQIKKATGTLMKFNRMLRPYLNNSHKK